MDSTWPGTQRDVIVSAQNSLEKKIDMKAMWLDLEKKASGIARSGQTERS